MIFDGNFELALLIVIIIVAFSFYKLGFTRGFQFAMNSTRESVKVCIKKAIELGIAEELKKQNRTQMESKKSG